ncbi:tetratricopeptide repeat protein [Salinigranum salinum]|uniref:tetratricopeptide repeat protein n=1 Tax=Salinigranum salinum TaxID=1364937 RepID=UPI001260B164|nr:tetratricopeptide repeat protein [Salinigranum salinum]
MSTASGGDGGSLRVGLDDRASSADSLNFAPYVTALRQFLLHASPPLTVSIEGEWGAGKSSFMCQLRERLEADGHVTVEFNPWRHQSEEALWAAFMLTFITQVSGRLTVRDRFLARLTLLWVRSRTQWKRVLLRVSVTLLIYALAVSAVGVLGSIVGASRIQTFLGTIGVTAVSGAAFLVWINRNVVGRTEAEIRSQLSTEPYEDRVSFVERFHDDFEQLLDAYVGTDDRGRDRRVFVFVDDLDRCELSKIPDLMEAVHLMLSDDSRLVFLIGMDRQKVAAAIAAKHREVLSSLDADGDDGFDIDYGNRYLEKFIQIPFDVPKTTEADIDEFVRTVAVTHPTADGQAGSGHQSWIAGALGEFCRTPTETAAPVSLAVSGCSPDRLVAVTELVARSLDHNPRQLKRFLNLYTLSAILEERMNASRDRSTVQSDERVVPPDSSPEHGETDPSDPTPEQIGKFAVIPLRWPRLHAEIQRNPGLLPALTLVAYQREFWKAYHEACKGDDTDRSGDRPNGETDSGGRAAVYRKITDRVARQTAAVPADDVRTLLDLLVAGVYEDEGSSASLETRVERFETLVEEYHDDADRGIEEFFTNVGPVQIERAIGGNSDYSLANVKTVRSLLGTSPRTAAVSEEQYEQLRRYEEEIDENPNAAWIRIDYANLLSELGKVVEAEAQYVEALGIPDSSQRARKNYIAFLVDRGKHDEADEQYRNALDRNPDDLWLRVKYIEFLLDRDRHSEADEQYRRALDRSPDDPWLRSKYIEFLVDRSRHDEADEQYREALDSDPERFRSEYIEFLVDLGRLDDAETQHEIACEQNPDDPWCRRSYARFLADQGRTDEADREYRTALELAPDDSDARATYAEFLHSCERYDQVETQYQAALELAPDAVQIRRRYAAYLYERERYDQAETQYQAALELDPANRVLVASYAGLLLERGNHGEADELYQTALDHDPDNQFLWIDRADSLVEQGRYDDADEVYRTAIDRHPDSLRIHRSYAEFLADRERGDEAEDQYRIAAELGPDEPWLRVSYAEFLVGQDRPDDADEQYRAALEHHPENPFLRTGYAVFLMEQNRLDDAEIQLKKAIALRPEEASTLDAYATLLHRRGDVEGAEEQYQRALDLGPVPEIVRSYAEFLVERGRDEAAAELHEKARELESA